MSLNKVMLIGNLGADPEKRVTPEGRARTNFRIATTEKWKSQSGEMNERTDWHTIITWGKLAETCAEYLNKGRQVFIEGRIRYRSWDDKNTGQKRWTTEIQADNVRFLGSAAGRTNTNANANTTTDTSTETATPGFDPNSDDVPF